MPNILCTVATPTRELYSGMIAYADVPGASGNFGVMRGHEMFVTTNRAGVVTLWLDPEGKQKVRFAIQEGATQVYNDRVTILGRFGVNVENINAEEIKQKAEKLKAEIDKMSEKKGDDFNEASLETHKAHLLWYETQLRVADGSLK